MNQRIILYMSCFFVAVKPALIRPFIPILGTCMAACLWIPAMSLSLCQGELGFDRPLTVLRLTPAIVRPVHESTYDLVHVYLLSVHNLHKGVLCVTSNQDDCRALHPVCTRNQRTLSPAYPLRMARRRTHIRTCICREPIL